MAASGDDLSIIKKLEEIGSLESSSSMCVWIHFPSWLSNSSDRKMIRDIRSF